MILCEHQCTVQMQAMEVELTPALVNPSSLVERVCTPDSVVEGIL